MHLAIFDIDGTLVDSAGFDGVLYAEAVREVLGVEIVPDWGRYANVTDDGILSEVIETARVPGDRAALHARVREAFVRRTRAYVEREPSALREVAGARALVEVLRARSDVAVAIATGGWRETAELKLRGIGLDPRAIPLATSSDAPDRRGIIARAECEALRGATAQRRTYFGDGVWDREAAAASGYAFVAVGDGVEHDVVVPDLADQDAIMQHLRL